MPTHALTESGEKAFDPATLEPFLAAFRGAVIRDGDADYDAARRIWNASIDKRPRLIAPLLTTRPTSSGSTRT